MDRRAGKSITSNENPHRELKGKKHEKTSDGTGYSAFFATLAVIVIHMGRIPFVSDCWASGWLPMSIAPYVWCVPVFFMISGRFFLDPAKDIPLKVLFQKYIFRLILAFLLWSAVYTAYYVWDGT